MYNNIAYLEKRILSQNVDEYGDQVETLESKMVFCNIMSIGSTEFYQAQSCGIKPEIKIVLADYYDYNNEQTIVIDNIRYKVLRTYRTLGTNELEITLYGGVREDECTEVSN